MDYVAVDHRETNQCVDSSTTKRKRFSFIICCRSPNYLIDRTIMAVSSGSYCRKFVTGVGRSVASRGYATVSLPSVCDVQVSWSRNNFKLRCLLGLIPTWAIWSKGNIFKIRENRGGSWAQNTCNIAEAVQDRTKVTMTTDGKSQTRTVDSYQNQWPWMTLNGQNALLQKLPLSEDRPILSVAKCRPMALLSRNIRCSLCRYSRGFVGEEASVINNVKRIVHACVRYFEHKHRFIP